MWGISGSAENFIFWFISQKILDKIFQSIGTLNKILVTADWFLSPSPAGACHLRLNKFRSIFPNR